MLKRGALAIVLASLAAASSACALDLNSFRAQNGRSALRPSGTLGGLAYEQAHDMATRKALDHKDYRARLGSMGTMTAENVLVGCADEDCAIRGWARSPHHRANMLRGDVSHYGIASATGANGRTYWALELGGE